MDDCPHLESASPQRLELQTDDWLFLVYLVGYQTLIHNPVENDLPTNRIPMIEADLLMIASWELLMARCVDGGSHFYD